MIRLSLYRRLYLAALLVVLAFVLIGGLATHWIMRSLEGRMGPGLPLSEIQSISEAAPDQRPALLARIEKEQVPFRFLLIDERSNVIYPPGGSLNDFHGGPPEGPPNEHGDERHGGPPPMGNGFFPPPFSSPPPPPRHPVRLSGSPTQYLFVDFNPEKAPLMPIFLILNGALLLSLALGVGVALLLILRSFKNKVELADGVISEIKRGNLKARFPIRNMDEVGQFMNRFNQMADEIERLVEQIKSGEKARMALLQDLAHDLRTPVASMKHMLEILQIRDATLDSEVRLKFLGLSIQEVEYFARLVEDLLVLAQVSEPRYQANQSALNLNELLNSEIDLVMGSVVQERKIEIERKLSSEPLIVRGDEHLLRRMLRNLLDNAISFARSRVLVKLEKASPTEVQITIEDDGPGFSTEALRCYGERRVSRSLPNNGQTGRVSVGLGSVIVSTVAHLHRGGVQVKNEGGGKVALRLPAEEHTPKT